MFRAFGSLLGLSLSLSLTRARHCSRLTCECTWFYPSEENNRNVHQLSDEANEPSVQQNAKKFCFSLHLLSNVCPYTLRQTLIRSMTHQSLVQNARSAATFPPFPAHAKSTSFVSDLSSASVHACNSNSIAKISERINFIT